MRLILLLILILLLDLYAFQALRLTLGDWSSSLKIISYVLYWSIPALTILMLSGAGNELAHINKDIFSILRAILFIFYFSKFLIVVVLLVGDLARFLLMAYETMAGIEAFSSGRSKFLGQFALFMGGLPFLTLTYGILRNRHRYTVFHEKVAIPGLPDTLNGLRIVQISDIHSGSFTLKDPVRSAIDIINAQKADLVFFTGDLVNSLAIEMDLYVDVFDKIKARYGVYSVLGNHDYGDYVRWNSPEAKKANLEKLKNTHRLLGWDLLMNEHRILNIKGEKVAVIGVENYSAHPRFPKYGDLPKAIAGTQGAALKLLLSHDPSHWEDEVITKYTDIDITFSGHTHGFQFGIEIPGLFKWSPVKYIYKQWAGLYQQGRQYLYVNRGLGFLGYPGRVGILPEITVVELKKKS